MALNTVAQKTYISGHALQQMNKTQLLPSGNSQIQRRMQQSWSSAKPSAWATSLLSEHWLTFIFILKAAAQMEANTFRMSEKISLFRTNYSPLRAGRGLRDCLILAMQCGPSILYLENLLAWTVMSNCSSSPVFSGSCGKWETTCSGLFLILLWDISSRTFHCYFKLYVFTSKLIHPEISLSHPTVFWTVIYVVGLPASQGFLCISVCAVVFEQSFGQMIAFIYSNEYLFI